MTDPTRRIRLPITIILIAKSVRTRWKHPPTVEWPLLQIPEKKG